MTWLEKREQIKTKLDAFAEQNQTTMSTDQLATLKSKYEEVRTGLTNYLKDQARKYELSSKLEETGTLQTQLKELET